MSMDVIKKLEENKAFYETELTKINGILPTLPNGTLFIYVKDNCYAAKYSIKTKFMDKTEEFPISKKDEFMVAALALRKVLTQRKDCYEARLNNTNTYLDDNKNEPREFIKDKYSSEFYRLIRKYYPEFSNDWEVRQERLNQKYERCESDPISHNVATTAGIMVRSKSEAIIVDILYSLRIPFVYEPKIVLSNGKVVYPDFIIVDPTTGTEYMWEHFGRLDDQEYVARSLNKVYMLNELGWRMGINLIITTETLDDKFTTIKARDTVNQYISVAA